MKPKLYKKETKTMHIIVINTLLGEKRFPLCDGNI